MTVYIFAYIIGFIATFLGAAHMDRYTPTPAKPEWASDVKPGEIQQDWMEYSFFATFWPIVWAFTILKLIIEKMINTIKKTVLWILNP